MQIHQRRTDGLDDSFDQWKNSRDSLRLSYEHSRDEHFGDEE